MAKPPRATPRRDTGRRIAGGAGAERPANDPIHHARAIPVPQELQEPLRRLCERVPFAAITGPEGEHACVWAEFIATLAQAPQYDVSRNDLATALRILRDEVQRRRDGETRSARAREIDPALRAELTAAFEAGRSRHDVVREHLDRRDARKPPWASEDAIKDFFRKWKKRPNRLIRAGN